MVLDGLLLFVWFTQLFTIFSAQTAALPVASAAAVQ